MAIFRAKRVARDAIARRRPDLYEKYIRSVASKVPALSLVIVDDSALELAQAVAPFYHDEYVDAIDDAAKGRFTLLNQTVDFGNADSIDWHHELDVETDFHLWRQKFAHMGYLCPMLSIGDSSHLEAVQRIIASYRGGSSFGRAQCFSSYWFPYSVSHRLLAILSGYIVGMQKKSLSETLQNEVEQFLRWNAGFLLANIEHELRNNHVERNLAALCMYYSCVAAAPATVTRRLDREVRKIMKACVLSDGFCAERSAMYQGLAVMSLAVFSKSRCLSPDTRAVANNLHSKAVRAWQLMAHPDGDIALFNDSWFGEVPRPASVAPVHIFESLETLPHAGYARLESGAFFALMDAGPIGPPWCPGHGHADFLSAEIDIAQCRFIVDPGTFQYSTGPRRAAERSASSHNGPICIGVEPVEYTGCFRVGRMNEARFMSRSETKSGGNVMGRIELRNGVAMQRTLGVDADSVRVVDEWLGDEVRGCVELIVADEWVMAGQSNDRIEFTSAEAGVRVELSVLNGSLDAVGQGEWSSNYLESRPATAVSLRPQSSPNGAQLSWQIRTLP